MTEEFEVQLQAAESTINKLSDIHADLEFILEHNMAWSREGDTLDQISDDLYEALNNIKDMLSEAIDNAKDGIDDLKKEKA